MVPKARTLLPGPAVNLRLISFGVRPKLMFPPEVGFDTEGDIFSTWREQAHEQLRSVGVSLNVEADREVAVGSSWQEAIDEASWQAHKLLAVGSQSAGAISRVFLGDNAHKIVRYARVPVLLVPS